MGLGSGVCRDESRFLGKCVGGGHAGIGRRRSAVGTENSLRCVNRQNACGEKPPKRRLAQAPSAAAEVLLFDSGEVLIVHFARGHQ